MTAYRKNKANRLKISTRLTILITLLSALLVGIGLIGILGISRSNEALKTVFEDRTVPMGQLAEINRLNLRSRLAIDNSLLDPNPTQMAKDSAEVEANIEKMDQVWASYIATTLTDDEAIIAQKFANGRTQFVQDGLRPALMALRSNNVAEAHRLTLEKVNPLYPAVQEGIDGLMKLQVDVAKNEYDAAVSRYTTFRLVAIGSIFSGLLIAVILGIRLIRGITGPLRDAVAISNAIARGDLSQTIYSEGRDEVAALLQALSAMQDHLADVVSTVRMGSDSVATASAQIASGNHDLSARTEQQASALEQTAASMEELSAAVKKNADSAKLSNQLALSASDTAVRGGEVVALVVDTMKGINDSARKITDIISVIEGISFQTNILALNAAVEAARAGEQGRGFAVVASEVRSLAGRSADAAKEIKSLINASVERVGQGTLLVDQAGATMTEVVKGIQRVTDLMGEISTASHEQSLGVSQVGDAVTQMDQVTQQNAALVEEMAAAASSLKTQAQELVQTVSMFKVSGNTLRLDVASNSAAVRSRAPKKFPFFGKERRAHPQFKSKEAV